MGNHGKFVVILCNTRKTCASLLLAIMASSKPTDSPKVTTSSAQEYSFIFVNRENALHVNGDPNFNKNEFKAHVAS